MFTDVRNSNYPSQIINIGEHFKHPLDYYFTIYHETMIKIK